MINSFPLCATKLDRFRDEQAGCRLPSHSNYSVAITAEACGRFLLELIQKMKVLAAVSTKVQSFKNYF
jgi:hypothetical protein